MIEMTRIDASNLVDREAIRAAYGKVPLCNWCEKQEATIWVRGKFGNVYDYFLCDACALELAHILIHDLHLHKG
jgi:hypothetical protein